MLKIEFLEKSQMILIIQYLFFFFSFRTRMMKSELSLIELINWFPNRKMRQTLAGKLTRIKDT